MARTRLANGNAGQIAVHGGFRLRPRAGGITVTYLRTTANSHLPRSFIWTDAAAIDDLKRYLDGLVQQADSQFVRDCEDRGYVTDTYFLPAAPPSQPRICRASIPWLAEVVHGREPLSVAARARIHLRTDRNGLVAAHLPTQFVEHGLLTAAEAHQPLPPARLRTPSGGMEVLAQTPWDAGAVTPLVLDEKRFLHSGFLFTATKRAWRASAVITGRIGHVKSFTWRGGERWDQLAVVLTAIRHRRYVTLAGMVDRSRFIDDLEVEQDDPPADAITVSPQRLAALLRGEDPLQLPSVDLCTWVHVGQRWFPRHFSPSLVDRRLDVLHALACAARKRLGLPVTGSRPVSVTDPMTTSDGTGDLRNHGFSGANLLPYGCWSASRRHRALARGDLPGATPLSEVVLHTYDDFAIASTRMHWSPYGNGTVRRILVGDAPAWLAWRADTGGPWWVLAQQAALLMAVETVCGVSPARLAADLDT